MHNYGLFISVGMVYGINNYIWIIILNWLIAIIIMFSLALFDKGEHTKNNTIGFFVVASFLMTLYLTTMVPPIVIF